MFAQLGIEGAGRQWRNVGERQFYADIVVCLRCNVGLCFKGGGLQHRFLLLLIYFEQQRNVVIVVDGIGEYRNVVEVGVALAFAVLLPPALLSPGHRVSMLWLLSCMTLLVVGELLIGPLGLSLLVRLAPPRFVGVVMGIWYVAGAVGCWLAGEVGALWMN